MKSKSNIPKSITHRIIYVDKEIDWNEFFMGHLKLVNPC